MITELTVAVPVTASIPRALNEVVQATYRAWLGLVPPLSSRESQAACALEVASAEAASDNWDGYGGQAVTYGVKLRAQAFLDALPEGVPLPIIGLDPDGEIAFEWYLGPRQVFSVSVGERYEVAYAGLFGVNSSHGTEYFMDELPSAVMDNLRRLYGGNGAPT
ncbi:MAG: hypothetical protein ACREA0_07215 [bacterium]